MSRQNSVNPRLFVLSLVVLAALTGLTAVPTDYPKTASTVVTDTDQTTAAKVSKEWRKADQSNNGFYPLIEGEDAFGARLALMDNAERSIDAQYFLMKPDDAGLVFAHTIMEAADRGVRVRFLLDDIFTTVDDRALIYLNEHPNIELRIFNPIARKGVWILNFLWHFSVTNRRMHNKSLTIDNELSVVGGRNIAKEYFQLDSTGEFIDFDVVAAGPIVRDISHSFDAYWNHELAVPMNAFYGSVDADEQEQIRQEVDRRMEVSGHTVYGDAVNKVLMQRRLTGGAEPFIADARIIVDDPQKLMESVSDEHKVVATDIAEALDKAQSEILIYTPYFIPGKRGMDLIRRIRAKGVRIVLVTNSLASNNQILVHSAYSSYRKRLLAVGVELWEVRASAMEQIQDDGTRTFENSTLHTKGIMIDRRFTFAGSLNLDPRSIDLNSEMGIMIDSEAMASVLAELVTENLPNRAYKLQLDDSKITWHATIDGRQVVETKEPLTSGWKRFQAWFMKIAPEGQL
jgi:putative cardiolipin synthase